LAGEVRKFKRFGIDMTKHPILVYPTLHYQNGGVEINENCETGVPGLFAAGEVTGGVHGRNRLMGNSVLDYNVFGRRAGIITAKYVKNRTVGKLTLSHIDKYNGMLAQLNIMGEGKAPIILPEYRDQDTLGRSLDIL
jgi:succinate dehydrogenase/fumarate reductase flavoprotein subunit